MECSVRFKKIQFGLDIIVIYYSYNSFFLTVRFLETESDPNFGCLLIPTIYLSIQSSIIEIVKRYFENEWIDFVANWHKCSTKRRHENYQLWGSCGQKLSSHKAIVGYKNLSQKLSDAF